MPTVQFITKTHLFKYIENSTTKNWKFSYKNSDIFLISAQNIHCRVLVRTASALTIYVFCVEIRKIMFTSVNPSFTIQKWGLRGSKLYRHVFVMYSECVPWSLKVLSDEESSGDSTLTLVFRCWCFRSDLQSFFAWSVRSYLLGNMIIKISSFCRLLNLPATW